MRALAQQQLGDELIVRLVREERAFQVFVDNPRRLRTRLARSGAEQFRELHGPEFGELGPRQQPVDQLRSLDRVARFQELLRFLLRRKNADRVEINAAQKVFVACETRRLNVQAIQLGETCSSM